MMNKNMTNPMPSKDCKTCRTRLPELLLDEACAASEPRLAARLAAHLAVCTACAAELASLRLTFALLDDWTAPEPSPYFDSKLHVLLREEQAAQPEGFWERTRSFLLYSTGRQLRPALTGALALVMLLGGGGIGVGIYNNRPAPQASAAVNDLKILDNNAQAMQQMDQLLDDSAPGNTPDDNAGPPTT